MYICILYIYHISILYRLNIKGQREIEMFFNKELDIVERSDSSGLHGHDPSPKLTPQNL